MLAVYIGTKNDTNGNPRRGWILFDSAGTAHGFVDEGYEGHAALRAHHVKAEINHRIDVTPGEYRYWKTRQVRPNRSKRTSRASRASRSPKKNKRTSRRAR